MESLVSGPTDGTSIQDLYNREKTEHYENVRQMNYQDISQPADVQLNTVPVNVPNTGQGTVFMSSPSTEQQYDDDIENLARDIADNMPDNQGYIENTEVQDTDTKNSLTNDLPKLLKDPFIIVVLFIVLSQPAVIRNIGRYVPQILPNSNGIVPMSGLVIYGVLLATLYTLIKMYILQ